MTTKPLKQLKAQGYTLPQIHAHYKMPLKYQNLPNNLQNFQGPSGYYKNLSKGK